MFFAELLNIQLNTASALIKNFEKHGVLVKLATKKRSQLFGFSEYMAIFDRQTDVNDYEAKASISKDAMFSILINDTHLLN